MYSLAGMKAIGSPLHHWRKPRAASGVERDGIAREIALMRRVTVLCILLSVALPLAAAAILGGG